MGPGIISRQRNRVYSISSEKVLLFLRESIAMRFVLNIVTLIH